MASRLWSFPGSPRSSSVGNVEELQTKSNVNGKEPKYVLVDRGSVTSLSVMAVSNDSLPAVPIPSFRKVSVPVSKSKKVKGKVRIPNCIQDNLM